MTCPFCQESKFSRRGLKTHLEFYCDVYARTIMIGPADGGGD